MEETTPAQPGDPTNRRQPSDGEVVRSSSATPSIPTPGFSDLSAPDPIAASPPESARALAFVAILAGGLLGGLVGYGIGDVLYDNSTSSALGALAGALTGAIGLGVLANLTLRAMSEWKTAAHPESQDPGGATPTSSSNQSPS